MCKVFRKRADRIVHQLIEDMSYNICGFITNQKLTDKLEELSEALSVHIQSSEESTLEEALEDKDEYADIDVLIDFFALQLLHALAAHW